MGEFRRANPYLDEIIEILEVHLEKYQGDVGRARQYLDNGTSDWIDEELIHCMDEPRYFLSNYYAIKTEDKGFQGLYPFWDSQEILHDKFRWMEKEYGVVRAMINKARQMGSTTYVGGEIFHKTIFTEHINTMVVAQNSDQSRFILDMYTAAIDFLPWWMRPRVRYKEAGKFIDFDEKDDNLRDARPGLKTRLYADNGNKPTGAGRGKSFARAHLSELSWWEDATQLTMSLFPTMNSERGFYVMESTPNGRNNAWHNLWRQAEEGESEWTPIYIPFYRREKTYSLPLRNGEIFIPTEEESELRSKIFKREHFYIKDEVMNWRRKKIRSFIATGGDDKKFSQEYSSTAEESFQTSAVTAFPRPIINKLIRKTRNPRWIGEIYYDFTTNRPKTKLREIAEFEQLEYPKFHNRLHIWEMPEPGETYVVGVDVSLGNDGGDYSCCQVIKTSEPRKDKQVACWHGLMEPESLAEIVLAICWMYNEALAAVEVNNMGLVTNNALVRQFDYENIYRYKHLDKISRFMTDLMGFYSNEKTSRFIMAKLSKSLLEETIDIPCRFTCDEFNDFTEDGAVGEGAHDDMVDALMIALYCAHENETREIQESSHKAASDSAVVNEFIITDRFGTIIQETISQGEAQAISRKHIGSSIDKRTGTTAPVTINGKQKRAPKDFQNSDYSPIYDGDGTARRLYEDGYDPEEIDSELIAQYEAEMEQVEESEDAWKYV